MATRRSSPSLFFLLLAAFVALLAATSEAIYYATATSGAAELGWIPGGTACRGTIAECLAGDEFELDSEISRRILATSRYISYGALRADRTPCSLRGASYYNCRPGAYANPYHRGCSAIARCRR